MVLHSECSCVQYNLRQLWKACQPGGGTCHPLEPRTFASGFHHLWYRSCIQFKILLRVKPFRNTWHGSLGSNSIHLALPRHYSFASLRLEWCAPSIPYSYRVFLWWTLRRNFVNLWRVHSILSIWYTIIQIVLVSVTFVVLRLNSVILLSFLSPFSMYVYVFVWTIITLHSP